MNPASEASFDKRGAEHGEVWPERETACQPLKQMAAQLGRDHSVITRHIGNVFKEGKLEGKNNVQNLHIASYNNPMHVFRFDVIISVGYWVKPLRRTRFRQWAATMKLRPKNIFTDENPNEAATTEDFLVVHQPDACFCY